MRTHRLDQLPLRGRAAVLRALPAFDFYKLQEVRRLVVAPSDEAGLCELELDAAYVDADASPLVRLRFLGIRRARLPELAPSFALGELELEDVSGDQLEGIRFHAVDYSTGELDILCADVEVLLLTDESPVADALSESELARIERRCEAATPGATEADHDFIAAARQDVPRLVREVRALRAALARRGAP